MDGGPTIHVILQEVRSAPIEQRLAAIHVSAGSGQMQRRAAYALVRSNKCDA